MAWANFRVADDPGVDTFGQSYADRVSIVM
jgi:hypothetical protein